MADKITELREKREKVVQDQRGILDKASEEKRSLNTEEKSQLDKLDGEFDSFTTELNNIIKEKDEKRDAEIRKQKLEEREKELRISQGRQTDLEIDDPNKHKKEEDEKRQLEDHKKIVDYDITKRYLSCVEGFRNATKNNYSTNEYLNAYRRYIVSGINQLPGDVRNMLESRALQADNDSAGGFLVAPEKLMLSLIKKMDDAVFVRRVASVYPVPDAAALGAPALDTRMSDATWTAEIRTGSDDTSLDFDKRSLTPHPLARRIKVSKTLLRKSLLPVETIVSDEFGYNFSIVLENAYLNGDGQNKPLGVFTSSAQGINTDRDVSAGNTATAITGDGLRNCKYSLKKQYRMLPDIRWAFHRDAVKMISKLKTGDGDYIWRQGISQNDPDTILGIPYEESEYVPNTFTTGLLVGILGAWSKYWIADALNMQIQVLTELYAETNQNGYIARYEGDGMPVLSEAFARVKLG
ncbi:MAG: phage major capsid protein [Nitrosarchaeum sp.]